MHFGSGGGKGVTRVVTELAVGHASGASIEPFAVFRRKRGRSLAPVFSAALSGAGVPWAEVVPRPKSRTLTELRKLIRAFAPDVFVAHGYSEHIWGRLAAIAERVPCIIHSEHAFELYSAAHLRRLADLDNRTTAVVAVSRGVQGRLEDLGIPRQKLHVIHNGISSKPFSNLTPIESRRQEVLMVSRFARVKDHATVIKAIGLLKRSGRHVQLDLAGEGKWIHKLKVHWLIAVYGVRDRVRFLGHCDDVPSLLSQYRAAVISTRREGFGLVVCEAMMAGCAVVASRVSGIDELVRHDETGFLCEPLNPESMAAGIEQALGAPGKKWAEQAPREARAKFSVERMVREYESLFADTMSRDSASGRASQPS